MRELFLVFLNGIDYMIRKITRNEKREEKGSQIIREVHYRGVVSIGIKG